MICVLERNFKNAIPEVLLLSMICKTMIDKQLLKLSQTLLGCLYLHLGKTEEAMAIFDFLRDVAEECHNWSYAIQAYHWIGQVMQEQHNYENSIKAYKKMMQLSWLTDVAEYEIKSYH